MDQCSGTRPNSNILCKLQRHHEILNDNRKEYHKIRTSLQEQFNRDRLMEQTKRNDYEYVQVEQT